MIIPAMIVPGILFTLLAVYPFIEAFATGDSVSTTSWTVPATGRSGPRSASRC